MEAIRGGSIAAVLRYKIREGTSERLIEEAESLMIPLPDKNNEALWTVFDGYEGDDDEKPVVPVLTFEGINHLRAQIRAEKKARSDRFLMWTSGIVAIIGALTGLAAVLGAK